MEFEFKVTEDKDKMLNFEMKGLHLVHEIGHADTFDLEDLHKAVIEMKTKLITIYDEYSSKEKKKLREVYHQRLIKKYDEINA